MSSQEIKMDAGGIKIEVEQNSAAITDVHLCWKCTIIDADDQYERAETDDANTAPRPAKLQAVTIQSALSCLNF